MKRIWTLILVALFTVMTVKPAFAAPTKYVPAHTASARIAFLKSDLPRGMTPRTDVPDAIRPIIETDDENARLLVRYNANDKSPYKIRVSKKGAPDQYYVLYAIGADEYFPLPNGNGDYTVSVLRMMNQTRAEEVSTETVMLNAKGNYDAFLCSNYYVDWEHAPATKAFAKTLKRSTVKATVEAVYNEIARTMQYDYDNLGKLPQDYVPDMDTILKTRKGVCLDTAVLTAGLLRSLDIPTKLCFGYAGGSTGYHSWNEVLIDGKWMVMDITSDAPWYQAGYKVTMAKSASDFNRTSIY